MFLDDPYTLIKYALAMVIGLTLHELAHARTALAFGDPTAKMMGRVTFNPLAHLDLMGSICFIVSGGFGWAKPVPINQANLHPPRLGDIMVSLAGPMANFGVAVAGAMLLRLMDRLPAPTGHAQLTIEDFLHLLVYSNILLMLFNLIPLFPLDGHHIQREILPGHMQGPYMQWQMAYGRYILMALIGVPYLAQFVHLDIPSPLGYLMTYVGYPIYRWLVYA